MELSHVTLFGSQYIEENMGGANVHLTQEEFSAIQEIADEAEVQIVGDRYPVEYLKHTLGDTPEEKP